MADIVARLDNYLSTLEEEYEDLSDSDGEEVSSLKSYYDTTNTKDITDASMFSQQDGGISTEDTEMVPMRRQVHRPYLKRESSSAEPHAGGVTESLLGHRPTNTARRKTTTTMGAGRRAGFVREPPKEDIPYQLYDADEDEFV